MAAITRSVTSRPVRTPSLVPGSLLRARALWQQAAETCPAGALLVVLPAEAGPQRTALEHTVLQLRASGRRVMTYETSRGGSHTAIQGQLPLGL